uniref:Large ribosomal subunit protein uL10 n=1 Tax=Gasterosteus aculeatus aculeatus TaxID=481459 RepID=G3P160_GASAC
MPTKHEATWSSQLQLLDDYPKCFIVGADNVGSKQMQTIRLSLRGKAVVLMGKNTMMRKAIRGNVGFVFTKEDLAEVRDMLLNNKVIFHARANSTCHVNVPSQKTVLLRTRHQRLSACKVPGGEILLNDYLLLNVQHCLPAVH